MNERIDAIWRAAEKEYGMESNELKAILEGAFFTGAQWADQHPVNPCHDASKELPEMNGRMCQTIRYNKEQNRWESKPVDDS